MLLAELLERLFQIRNRLVDLCHFASELAGVDAYFPAAWARKLAIRSDPSNWFFCDFAALIALNRDLRVVERSGHRIHPHNCKATRSGDTPTKKPADRSSFLSREREVHC